jgi:hypothetical protein
MLKILLTQSPAETECVWCQSRKRHTVIVDFSNGFLRSKPMCFECLERATRVQFASDPKVKSESDIQSEPATESKSRSG